MTDNLALSIYGSAYTNQLAMGSPVYNTTTGTFSNVYNGAPYAPVNISSFVANGGVFTKTPVLPSTTTPSKTDPSIGISNYNAAAYFSKVASPTGPQPLSVSELGTVVSKDLGAVAEAVSSGAGAVASGAVNVGRTIVSDIGAIPGAVGGAAGDFVGSLVGGILKNPYVLLLGGVAVYAMLKK